MGIKPPGISTGTTLGGFQEDADGAPQITHITAEEARQQSNQAQGVFQSDGSTDTPNTPNTPTTPSNPNTPDTPAGSPVNRGGNTPNGNAFGVRNQMGNPQMGALGGAVGDTVRTVGNVVDNALDLVGGLLGGRVASAPSNPSSSAITPDHGQGGKESGSGRGDNPRSLGAPGHSDRPLPGGPDGHGGPKGHDGHGGPDGRGGPRNEGGPNTPPNRVGTEAGHGTSPGGRDGATNPGSTRADNVTQMRTPQSAAQTLSQATQTASSQTTNRTPAQASSAQQTLAGGFAATGQAAGTLAQATAQGVALPSALLGQLANLAGTAAALTQQPAEARQQPTTATPQQLPAQNESALRDLRNSPTQLPQAPNEAKRPPDTPADKALAKTPNDAQTQQQTQTRAQSEAQTRAQTDLRTVNQQRPADAQQTARAEGDAKGLREGMEKTKLAQPAEATRAGQLGEDAKKAAQLAANAAGRTATGTVETLRHALDWVGQQVRGTGADAKTDAEGVTAMRVVAGLIVAATFVGIAIAVLYAVRIAFVP